MGESGDDELGLTLNEAKTSLKAARTERFDFLGYTFGPHFNRRTAADTWAQVHRRKASKRIKTKIKASPSPAMWEPWRKYAIG